MTLLVLLSCLSAGLCCCWWLKSKNSAEEGNELDQLANEVLVQDPPFQPYPNAAAFPPEQRRQPFHPGISHSPNSPLSNRGAVDNGNSLFILKNRFFTSADVIHKTSSTFTDESSSYSEEEPERIG